MAEVNDTKYYTEMIPNDHGSPHLKIFNLKYLKTKALERMQRKAASTPE